MYDTKMLKSIYRTTNMEILQSRISDSHISAMFFHNVIAWGSKGDKIFVLRIEQEGEIEYKGKVYTGKEIRQLGLEFLINDNDIDSETNVTILVDAWFVISEVLNKDFESVLYATQQDESLIFDNYDEAIEMFDEYLK